MRALLLLLLLAVWVSSGAGREQEDARCSPSSWCSSVEAAARCGVLQQCLEANLTRSRDTAEPVRIGLYYESLCPGCRGFLTSMLYPTSVLLGDLLDLTLVPYGNAKESIDGDRYIFKCQHGEQECAGNMIEACLLNLTSSKAFSVIYCMELAEDPLKAARACVQAFVPGLSWEKLMTCANGDLGNHIMHQNALKTEALKPTHTYVPWITVNGEHSEDLQSKAFDGLLPLVCELYKGEKPPICGGKSRHFRSYSHK
ncbi:unnamed protein product [Knipowitschia caucasica]